MVTEFLFHPQPYPSLSHPCLVQDFIILCAVIVLLAWAVFLLGRCLPWSGQPVFSQSSTLLAYASVLILFPAIFCSRFHQSFGPYVFGPAYFLPLCLMFCCFAGPCLHSYSCNLPGACCLSALGFCEHFVVLALPSLDSGAGLFYC